MTAHNDTFLCDNIVFSTNTGIESTSDVKIILLTGHSKIPIIQPATSPHRCAELSIPSSVNPKIKFIPIIQDNPTSDSLPHPPKFPLFMKRYDAYTPARPNSAPLPPAPIALFVRKLATFPQAPVIR